MQNFLGSLHTWRQQQQNSQASDFFKVEGNVFDPVKKEN
jgi:hypothetical protein